MSYKSLNTPQYINLLDYPHVNQNFIQIIRSSGSLTRANSFRFEPDLYAHLLGPDRLPVSSPQQLARHYYDQGLETLPICARNVIDKLFPDLNYDPVTFDIKSFPVLTNPEYANLSELVYAELYNKPGSELLDWFMAQHVKVLSSTLDPASATSYKLIIQVHISNPELGHQILRSIQSSITESPILQGSTLLLINLSSSLLASNPDYANTMLSPNGIQHIILSTLDLGTDIQPYFLSLYYLTKNYPTVSADYILKLHTKSDVPTLTLMLDAFSQSKLASAIAHLDNPAYSNIDIIGAKTLVMPNYHVKELLTKTYPLTPAQDHNKFIFVAGSSFLSRFNIQQSILAKYTPTLIKQSLFNGQYYTGWLFDKNSPAHALERIIGGFESQANGKQIASIQI